MLINACPAGRRRIMHRLLTSSLGLLLILSVAQAQAPNKTQSPSATQHTNTSSTVSAAPEDYTIGPQDVLRIDVWKEPEISRSIPVRPDGKISLPLLDDVQAAGLTAMKLAGNIRDGLTKFITNPQVTVTVSEINSRRVFINGEVGHQGTLPLIPNMTALQALSSAGGFTQFARTSKIYILRTQGGQQSKIPFNYKEVLKGKSADVILQPGDVIVVP
jgi:polysaccharide biosynthesis/export protein